MFTPWIKRKALKKDTKSKRLVVDGERPSMIVLLSLSVLMVLAGVFVVQKSLAANLWGEGGSGSSVRHVTPVPSATVTPSVSSLPRPTHGPSQKQLGN